MCYFSEMPNVAKFLNYHLNLEVKSLHLRNLTYFAGWLRSNIIGGEGGRLNGRNRIWINLWTIKYNLKFVKRTWESTCTDSSSQVCCVYCCLHKNIEVQHLLNTSRTGLWTITLVIALKWPMGSVIHWNAVIVRKTITNLFHKYFVLHKFL